MHTRTTPARSKSTALLTTGSSSRDEGCWRDGMMVFKGEIQRLKEENDVLKSTTTELSLMWKKAAERMDLLTSENQSCQKVLLDMLDEERQRAKSLAAEKKELQQKLEETKEKYTASEVEVRRLAELLGRGRKGNTASVAVHENALVGEVFEFEAQLCLREKRLLEMQQELGEEFKRVKADLNVKDDLLATERNQWERQKELYEDERSRLLQQLADRRHASRFSLDPANREASAFSDKQPHAAPLPLHIVTEEDVGRNAYKKSRLEAVRRQRRLHEKQRGEMTLASLNKLNDLRGNMRL